MGSGPSLEVTGKTAADPATQRRQEHLWQNAERFAAGQPFQQEYGYGSQMVPGLTGMQQTGQQYLADRILGKGAYGLQSLGFQDYRRPVDAPVSDFQYGQSGYAPGQVFQPGYQAGRLRSGAPPEGGDASMAWGGGGYAGDIDDGSGTGYSGEDLTDIAYDPTDPNQDPDDPTSWESTGQQIRQRQAAQGAAAQYGTTPYQPGGYPIPQPDVIAGGSSKPGEGEWQEAQPGSVGYAGPWDPWGVGYTEGQNPPYEQNIWDTPDIPFGAQNLPTGESAAAYAARTGGTRGGGLLQTDLNRPTAGVGIGEIEDARTATRRMLLEQGRTGDPGYNQFLQGGGTPGTPGYVAPGWQGISAPGYRQFMDVPTGGTAPGTWQGLAEAGTGTAPTTPGVGLPGDFAVPTVDEMAIRGQVDPITGKRATPFGIKDPTGVTVGDIDPTTGQPLIDPDTGLPAGDIRAVTAPGMEALAPWQKFDAAGDPTDVGYQPRYDAIAAGSIVPTTLDEGGEPIPGTAPEYSVTGPTAADYTAAKLGTLTGGFQLGQKDKLGAAIPGTGLLTAGKIGPDAGYDIAAPDPLYKGWDTAQLGERGTDKVTDILGQIDPVTGVPLTGKGFREGWGITDPTVGGADWDADAAPWKGLETVAQPVGEDWLDVSKVTAPTLTPVEQVKGQTAAAQTAAGRVGYYPGLAAGLLGGPTDVTVDPLTGQTAGAAGAVTPGTIAGPGAVTVDPVTGQVGQAAGAVTPGTIAGPGAVSVDPVTGQMAGSAGGPVTPGAFGGASFLTGDLGSYMDLGGVESQVTAAQQAYAQAQNVEQARRAQAKAWGTRGDIPRAEQEAQMLARIADIRRKGYTDAANRMESDLQRQQAAGMQTQQLGTQAGLQSQQIEAQRREANAARSQQAAMQGQQLGFQGQLQTQQLAQAGDIRGAELAQQAAMQGQQLEAERFGADAARRQQAAMQGQQLGTQAAMQTQQLGQAAGIRGAELGVQTGLAGQQLEAQRQSENAARAQQAAMQGQQLGTQAEMQTQQLQQGADVRRAELGAQAGLAGQQLEAQRLESNAARAQQALLSGQQLGGQYGLQTQALGQQAATRNAEMDMQAALANQQAALQTGTQSQQLEAQRQIEQARLKLSAQQQTQQLGVQTGLAAQQLEAQRVGDRAGRAQQAALAQQQVGAQAALQRQELGVGADIRKGELDLQASLANQQAAMQSGSQTQQIQSQRDVRQAEMAFQRAQQTQQLKTQAGTQKAAFTQEGRVRQSELDLEAARSNQAAQLQTGSQSAQLEAGRRQRKAELDLQRQQGTQALTGQAAMQKQQLQQQTYIQSAQNDLESARADQQTAFQSGNQTAQLEAQRKIREAELKLQTGMQTQQLGAGAAQQQTQNEFARRQALAQMGLTSAQQQSQNEFARRQGLAQMGLQAAGMGMDEGARFRAQQMQAAQQLAGIGGMEQAATFGAAGQLGAMGAAQQQARQQQAVADYTQWLRGQEGGAEELAMLQAMQPMAQMQQWQRKPSMFGQIAGGLLAGAGTVGSFMNPVG